MIVLLLTKVILLSFFLWSLLFCCLFCISWLIILFAFITFFIIWFFRNPERYFQEEEKVLISPADGKVIKIEDVEVNGTVSGRFKKISIFMNVFNVHVNRAVYSGKIETINYLEGKFFSANLDKASLDNERNEIMIRSEDGHSIWMVQIAGLLPVGLFAGSMLGRPLKRRTFRLNSFWFASGCLFTEDSQISVKLRDNVKAVRQF